MYRLLALNLLVFVGFFGVLGCSSDLQEKDKSEAKAPAEDPHAKDKAAIKETLVKWIAVLDTNAPDERSNLYGLENSLSNYQTGNMVKVAKFAARDPNYLSAECQKMKSLQKSDLDSLKFKGIDNTEAKVRLIVKEGRNEGRWINLSLSKIGGSWKISDFQWDE